MIAAIESREWSAKSFNVQFFELFNDEFDELAAVLGDVLLASYLLALDQFRNETIEFAEGDDDPHSEAEKAAEAEATAKMTAGPIKLRFNVPPEEAIDYFKSKRVVTRKVFDKLADDARSSAFTVSGVYKQDVLSSFKDQITKALEKGTAQGTVIKRFREILDGAGHRQLGNKHLETIFRTNAQMSYGTGRRRALESVSDDLSFWQYHAVMDDRVRPTHAALNGLILPANHPFWNAHFPPIDFNCRCTVIALEEIPEGYDRSKPNGENHIIYDENDMPVKTKIGGSAHDLTVSRFKGIPPKSDLRDVIEARVKTAKIGEPK